MSNPSDSLGTGACHAPGSAGNAALVFKKSLAISVLLTLNDRAVQPFTRDEVEKMKGMMRRSSAMQLSGLETELEHDRRSRAYLAELDRARAFTRNVRTGQSPELKQSGQV